MLASFRSLRDGPEIRISTCPAAAVITVLGNLRRQISN